MVFYEQLAADNSKTFWHANKPRFDESVKQPMLDLTAKLDDFGPFHMFRPHNDLRFSKNKPPYKTQQGAYGESEGGTGYYVQFSAEGLMVGAGYYAMAKDQLVRFRAAIDAEATGSELVELVADAKKRRYSISAMSELKTAPRGYPKDHPRIELLRRKGSSDLRSGSTPPVPRNEFVTPGEGLPTFAAGSILTSARAPSLQRTALSEVNFRLEVSFRSYMPLSTNAGWCRVRCGGHCRF